MITFSVCPHDTAKGVEKWKKMAEELSRILGEEVDFTLLGGFDEEYRRLESGVFFDLYYAGPLISPRLYAKGYVPVAKLKGQKDELFLIKRGNIPEDGPILVATPFLRPTAFLLMLLLDIERVQIILVENFYRVYELLKEEKAHVGLMYRETWDGLEDTSGFEIVEGKIFESSHLFMVRRGLADKVKRALLSLEGVERAGEEELKRTEELLREFENLSKLWSKASVFHAMDRSYNIGVLIYSDRILYVNDSLLRMIGYRKDELLGVRSQEWVLRIIHPAYRELVSKVVSRRKTGEFFIQEYAELPLIRKDGLIVWTEATSETILYEGNYAGVVFFVDKTKRKRVERLYELLKDVNQEIIKTNTEKELFQRVCKSLIEKLGLKLVWVGVPEEKKEFIVPWLYEGEAVAYLEGLKISTSEDTCPATRAYRENRIYINQHTGASSPEQPWIKRQLDFGLLSSCILPLSVGEEVSYLLNLYADEPYFFQEETENLLYELKDDLEFALKKIQEERKNYIISAALKNSTSWVVITDERANIIYVNDAVCLISGYGSEELIGKNMKIFKSGYHTEDFYSLMWETILSGQEFHALFVNRRKDGEIFYIEQTIYPLRLSDGTLRFISVGKDITREVYLSSEVERLTFYDPVTGTFNFESLKLKAREMLEKGKTVALVLIDIWGMSMINRTYGIQAGDRVLQEIASRLLEIIDKRGLVGRVAGDEFAVLFLAEKDSILLEILSLVEEIMNRPVILEDGSSVRLSYNAGISLYPSDALSFGELHEKASIALMNAKRAGEGEKRFFEAGLEERLKSTNLAINLVHRAVEEGLFVFYYQPYFRGEDLSVAGFEALVRIRDVDGRIYGPAHFIDYLENSKYLKSFESFLLQAARSFHERHGLPVSINISARSFEDTQFIDALVEQLKGCNIIVEITERVLMANLEKAIEHMHRLKSVGVKIALDDFGTGYSSLSYLSSIPVDVLKIDISFVRQITTDPKMKAVIKSLVSLSEDLGIKTLAEGVETQEQLEILQNMRCTYLQGYLLGKPMPEDDALKLISVV